MKTRKIEITVEFETDIEEQIWLNMLENIADHFEEEARCEIPGFDQVSAVHLS